MLELPGPLARCNEGLSALSEINYPAFLRRTPSSIWSADESTVEIEAAIQAFLGDNLNELSLWRATSKIEALQIAHYLDSTRDEPLQRPVILMPIPVVLLADLAASARQNDPTEVMCFRLKGRHWDVSLSGESARTLFKSLRGSETHRVSRQDLKAIQSFLLSAGCLGVGEGPCVCE